jgi:AraC-like DNA-binding protein
MDGIVMPATLETKMKDNNHSDLEFKTWGALLRTVIPGGYSLDKNRYNPFAGSVRTRCVSGLTAVEVGSNNSVCERTLRDIRRDEVDHFSLSLLVSGHATVSQNDRETERGASDCLLIDWRRPFSYAVNEKRFVQFVALLVPRRLVTSTIGFEPNGGLSWRSDTRAARLLSHLILDAQDCDPDSVAAEHHMQRAICDLLGALMASNDLLSYSSHREKTFARIREIAKHHCTDHEIGPREIANEAGISLRYLQKLFTARGTTCGRFIQSLRLEHAARLVRLRNQTRSGQPLADIAYLSGFQDYHYFSRLFRRHFGHPPSAEDDLDQNDEAAN